MKGFVMNRFAQSAIASTTLSKLMQGRDRVSVEDIISRYPDGITIDAFDIISTRDKNGEMQTYPVICFKESPKEFFFGGMILYNIIVDWVGDSSVEDTSEELHNAGGVKIVMKKTTTRDGHNLTNVSIAE